MTSHGSPLDCSEANKENIPYPHLLHGKTQLVLPPQSFKTDAEAEADVDVVSVPESLLTPCSSQKSNASGISTASTMSPRFVSGQRRESSDELDQDSEDGETTSRKEKSLGLLCQRFLIAMNEETRNSLTREVHLETVARKMNVEKRRIYDIVNVMEALDAMNKTNKSYYRWHGLEDLPRLMADLQKEAVAERLPERVLRVEQAMCSFTELSAGNKPSTIKEAVGSVVEDMPSPSVESPFPVRSRVDGRDRQGRNSLAQLCRRFLMVLLSNPKNSRRVSLDVASTVLIKDPATEGFEPPSRSRCRRLYDIANVLVALGMIKKVHYLFGTKKIPLFVYCGPEPDLVAKYDANACLERMLTTSSSAPQTPQMKATTAAMVHSLSLGKRSQSDANLARTLQGLQQKMPKMRSEDLGVPASSLMMFAELAAERLRLETASSDKAFHPSSSSNIPHIRINNGSTIPKPLPQHSANGFRISQMQSPLNLTKRFPVKVSSSGLQPIVLPSSPIWSHGLLHSPFVTSPLSCKPNGSTVHKLPAPSPTTAKHTVSNILGVSTKQNIPSALDHRNSSPFQVVKKVDSPAQKSPFGAIHNIQGRL